MWINTLLRTASFFISHNSKAPSLNFHFSNCEMSVQDKMSSLCTKNIQNAPAEFYCI